MTWHIKKKDIETIRKVIENNRDAHIAIIDRIEKNISSDDDKRIIVDVLSDEFARSGLDNNDEPNEYGIQLEYLIDQLNESGYRAQPGLQGRSL